MCWISKKVKKSKIATKPIKVYKILIKNGISPYQNFDYGNPLGKEYSISPKKLKLLCNSKDIVIEEGLHSYSVHPLIIKGDYVCGKLFIDYNSIDNYICYECEVPVGAEYAINEYGECVSTSLKFVKVFKQTFFEKLTNVIKLWYRRY